MRVREILACVVLVAGLTSAEGQDGLPAQWNKVGEKEGALVAFAKPGFTDLSVKDAAGKIIDFMKGRSSQPFLTQYRLTPGNYTATLLANGEKVSFPVRAGKTVFLDLAGSGMDAVSPKSPPELATLAAQFRASGGTFSDPSNIAPAQNALYFSRNTESPYPGPFETPGPKPPKVLP